MASHRLPSLATLRLGAATGMPGNNAEGKRPMKAPRVEPPAPPAAPPVAPPPPAEPAMLLLTHLPRDVISKVVTQAALDARNAEVPASAICAWMQRFCTAARVEGVPCDDYWYKLALAAFGVDPDAVPRSGQLKWMRGLTNKRSLSWREFFGSVCDAFFAHPNHVPTIRRSFPALLTYNLTQRQLDGALTALMIYGTNIIKTKRNLPTHEEAFEVLKADWARLMQGKPSSLLTYTWWPLMSLLLLRGAEPYTMQKYAALDHEVYVAIMATRGDALSTHERLSTEEALRRIADAVARGASLNVACVTVEDNPTVMFTLQAALVAKNGTIIRWLLDRGAKPFAPRQYYEMAQQYRYMRQLLTSTVYDYNEWQVDWDTTHQLFEQLFTVIEHLFDDPNKGPASRDFQRDGMQILNVATAHMRDNGWADDFHTPWEGVDPSEIFQRDGVDVVAGFKVKVYASWMTAQHEKLALADQLPTIPGNPFN